MRTFQLPDDAPIRALVHMTALPPPSTRFARWLRRRTTEATELLRLTLRLAAILSIALSMLAMLGLIAPPPSWPTWLPL